MGAAFDPPAAEGLRERKKRATRQRIADEAARLFAEHGYERVAVVDVARAAEVSEQTVYNYFPVKEYLVFDRSAAFEAALLDRVRHRPAGRSSAAALARAAHDLLDAFGSVPPEVARGGMPALVAGSAALRRAALDRLAGHADALAGLLAAEEGVPETDLGLRALALAQVGVFHLLVCEVGAAVAAGADARRAARALHPLVDAAFARLESRDAPR